MTLSAPSIVRPKSLGGENVPDRGALAGPGSNRLDPARQRMRLQKSMHPVMHGALAGGDRRPEQRRQHGLQRPQIPGHTRFHQAPQRGHLSRGHQGSGDVPIGAVPTHEEHLGFIHEERGIGVDSRGHNGARLKNLSWTPAAAAGTPPHHPDNDRPSISRNWETSVGSRQSSGRTTTAGLQTRETAQTEGQSQRAADFRHR